MTTHDNDLATARAVVDTWNNELMRLSGWQFTNPQSLVDAIAAALEAQQCDLGVALANLSRGLTRNVRRAVIRVVDLWLYEYAMKQSRYKKLPASRLLGVNRNTFHKRFEQLGLSVRKIRATAIRQEGA